MDGKSGMILGACVIVAALIVTLVPQPSARESSPVGRYQFGGVPGHAYVLDTATGQVWETFAPAGEGTNHPDFHNPKVK